MSDDAVAGTATVPLVRSDGTAAASFPVTSRGENDGPTAELEILRGELSRILVERTTADTDYRFDTQITAVDDHGLQQIGRLEGLIDLSLQQTAISDDGLIHLASLKNLRVLSLSGTLVSSQGISKLGQQSQLRRLRLSWTLIDDEALVTLSNYHQLVELLLDGTRVSDRGVVRLGRLPCLEFLSLQHTAATRHSVRVLRSAQPNSYIIR